MIKIGSKMKLIILAAALLFSFSAYSKNKYGLGVMIGAPTGISAKVLRSKKKPIDLGISFGNEYEVFITYLFPQKKRLAIEGTKLRWYWGLGGKLQNVSKNNKNDKLYFGPRASAGINHYFKKYYLEAFTESAVNVLIIPSSNVDIDIAAGVRYYF